MDRRQQKTQAAIFQAFTQLLAKRSYSRITVQNIIDSANIGRTTFYAHFKTKDELLQALCAHLLSHIMVSVQDKSHTHGQKAPLSLCRHLLQHLQENDHQVLTLLTCDRSEIFLRYFKHGLKDLFGAQLTVRPPAIASQVPLDLVINHVSSSFVDLVLWWLQGGRVYSPAQLDRYFADLMAPLLSTLPRVKTTEGSVSFPRTDDGI
ncbi:MAG: TetR/AcrR family transcriptional regulator [Candidatus Anaerobiospirillum merdipullorum]|uniref:TetR/AcrR family transcriptional regulator n=1 Tax=Candidatus Anaerobiospirillum merdipullorum TaxID=2838450 RepID=A0A9E2NU81_9GAMM|nr:TetR/AcrR family transcriptional regulator [Candidatus Anaerobiospirillum merdipullorum]